MKCASRRHSFLSFAGSRFHQHTDTHTHTVTPHLVIRFFSTLSTKMKPKKPLNHHSNFRIFAANSCEDILGEVDSKLLQFKLGSQSAEITCVHSYKQLTDREFSWISDLTEINMREHYDLSESQWNRKSKEKEFTNETARFLLCRLKTEDNDTTPGPLIAFVHFRFELDYEKKHPILYCYEIQVANDYQCFGLGAHLMNLLEKIALKFHMKSILLTCFKHNERSSKFYMKLGYTINRCSPSKCGQQASYEILCRKVSN